MKGDSLVLPAVLESEMVFEESIIKIRRDLLQKGQKPPYKYYTLFTHPFAVVVLATTADGSFLLTEEYRHPTGKVILSCPGGYVDPEEDPLVAAQRELMEETGYQAEDFKLLGSGYPYAGISSQKTLYVGAKNARLVADPKLDTSEVIRPVLMTSQKLDERISGGADLDSNLCAVLFFRQR